MGRISVGIRRWLFVLAGLVVLAGLAGAPPALAADVRRGDQIVVGPNDVVDDDLYASATTVVIDGTVKGDVVAFAQQITINGTVEGDLIGAAQVITINGTVNDHARVAAQVIVLSPEARIAHGVMAASYSLEQQQGNTIGGDLVYAGYQGLVSGTISRDLFGAAQALAIRGTVGRNVVANVGDRTGPPATAAYMPALPVSVPAVPPGLTVESSARIGGQVTYESRSSSDIRPGARIQGRVLQMAPPVSAAPPTAASTVADWAVDNLRRFIVLLLVGLGLLWVAPGFARNLANIVQTRPLPSVGWGIVSIVVFVVVVVAIVFVTILLAVLLGIVTLGGLVPPILSLGALADGALVVGFLIFVSYVAEVVMSYLVGRWLLQQFRRGEEPGRVASFIVGLIVFVAFTAIPVLGGLIGLVVDLLMLGALWIWLVSRRVPPPAIVGTTA